MRAQRLVDALLSISSRCVFAERDDVLAADVRGHDQDDVAEVDRAALAVGEPAVVEDLQEAR